MVLLLAIKNKNNHIPFKIAEKVKIKLKKTGIGNNNNKSGEINLLMGFVKRPINSQILAMSWYVYSIE
jgi:hypothetical protein